MLLNDVPADREVELAAEITQMAMAAGWTTAIREVAKKSGFPPLALTNMLNKVSKDQQSVDTSNRVPGLADWERQKMHPDSELAPRGVGKSLPPVHSRQELIRRLELARKAKAEKNATPATPATPDRPHKG